MQPLIKYASYVTGKRVTVEVDLSEGGPEFSYYSDWQLSDSDNVLLHEEASRLSRAAISSKLLLG